MSETRIKSSLVSLRAALLRPNQAPMLGRAYEVAEKTVLLWLEQNLPERAEVQLVLEVRGADHTKKEHVSVGAQVVYAVHCGEKMLYRVQLRLQSPALAYQNWFNRIQKN